MSLFTSVLYSSNKNLLFVGGSTDVFLEVANGNKIIVTSLVVLFIFIIFIKINKYNLKYFLLLIVFILWLMSGRTVGYTSYPAPAIKLGWFYIQTERIIVCEYNEDCEKLIAYKTSIEELPFWRIKVKNKEMEEVFFVGFIAWESTVKIIKDNLGNGKYTIL